MRCAELPPKARSAARSRVGRGTGRGGGADLLRAQLFWALRIGARGRRGAGGAAAAARRATRGSGGVGAVDV